MPLVPETFAIPVTSGVNITTPARLLPPMSLLEAENSRFPRGAGATKRRGHYSTRVRANKVIPPGVTAPNFTYTGEVGPFKNKAFPEGWVFGWGAQISASGAMTTALPTSTHPTAGLLFGAAQRDSEGVLWDGFRLLSRAPGQEPGAPLPTFNAVLPSLRSTPIAKINTAQGAADAADTGRIKVVAWIEGTDLKYTVQDSTTMAVLLAPTALGMTAVGTFKVMNVGDWVHILATESDLTLRKHSIHAASPTVKTSSSLGTCDTYFDAYKVSETLWAVLRRDTTTSMRISWHEPSGDVDNNYTAGALSFTGTTLFRLAIAIYIDTIAVVYRSLVGGVYKVRARTYNFNLTAQGSEIDLTTIVVGDSTKPVTIAPNVQRYSVDSFRTFTAYYDYTNGTTQKFTVSRIAGSLIYQTTKFYLYLSGQAWSVGNRTYARAGFSSPFQSSWFLVDEALNPVGRMEYITANVVTTAGRSLPSTNWRGTAPTCFHGAYGYKIRIQVDTPALGTNTPVVYADPSLKFFDLDMLPPLRAAQAGRSLFFAGAQVWSYDGLEITESGFHIVPEGVTGLASGTASGLSAGDYRYRVDLCYRNAYNEEHRSASFYTNAITTTAGQNIALTIPTCFTSRSNSYFLIYRNAANGTQWYLVNSRDPTSSNFKLNDQSVATVSFNDTGAVTDAQLEASEPHPANAGFKYLDQFSAPACEVIAAGHDRLWLAGGELGAGQVLPSRLFSTAEIPGFNAGLVVQVDRNAEPITAIGFVGESRFFFRRTQTYIHQGPGVDNTLNGAWEDVREAYGALGATGPEGLAKIDGGLLFLSPAGIRALGPGGALTPVGQPVDTLAKTVEMLGTLVVGEDQEARFYHRTGAIVFNYQYGTWSTWTVTGYPALNPDTKLALLGTSSGDLYEESDSLWTDNGFPYRQRVRFAWLRKGDLMDFQRVRRIGALGETDPTQQHKIHVDVFYNERDFPEEAFDWEYPGANTQNTDEFGAGYFGEGAFGDTDDE